MESDGQDNSKYLSELASCSGKWLSSEGPASDIVISTRIRLARNIVGFPFMSRADHDIRQTLVDQLHSTIFEASPDRSYQFVDVQQIDELDRRFLNERQLISRELCDAEGPRAVVIDPHEQISIMLNEEDHLRMQVLNSGLALEECWNQVNALDDAIESKVSFAYDESLGYLTACPTNVGTGIRVSVMLHLPALRITREIRKVHEAAQKINLAVRGLYGEGSQAMGDFYQISNQITLGSSEQELLSNLSEVIPRILGYERRVRDLLCRDNKGQLDDKVARALGTLRSARSISSEETMVLLSSLRLGINLGLIEDIDQGIVNELFVHIQPAHIQKIFGEALDTAPRNEARAEYLQRRLGDS